jgi:hypothetical protein
MLPSILYCRLMIWRSCKHLLALKQYMPEGFYGFGKA